MSSPFSACEHLAIKRYRGHRRVNRALCRTLLPGFTPITDASNECVTRGKPKPRTSSTLSIHFGWTPKENHLFGRSPPARDEPTFRFLGDQPRRTLAFIDFPFIDSCHLPFCWKKDRGANLNEELLLARQLIAWKSSAQPSVSAMQ